MAAADDLTAAVTNLNTATAAVSAYVATLQGEVGTAVPAATVESAVTAINAAAATLTGLVPPPAPPAAG